MNHWKYYTDGIYSMRKMYDAKYSVTFSNIDGMPLTEVIQNVAKHKLTHPELLDSAKQ